MPHKARKRLQFRYRFVTMRVMLGASQLFAPRRQGDINVGCGESAVWMEPVADQSGGGAGGDGRRRKS
ncbi:hypothetical protein [Methylocystis sp.]|jgi:hypothetical protein|uniref:hypothetical protein n=1 Tax=Methylocystis sp. TaxID=1911079 RepID=UPI003DA2F509